MRRRDLGRFGPMWALLMAFVCLAGVPQTLLAKPKSTPPKVKETVGDLADFFKADMVRVEGVGLVVGLDKTGSDPAPSIYREKLLDQMRKANVENADKILKDPRTSLVIVRAKIPIGATEKDPVDLEIELPPGSTTTSLEGGRLLDARLSEILRGGDNRLHEGAPGLSAAGPC